MMTSSSGTILITLASQSLVFYAGGLGTGKAAVNVAAVTMAANDGLRMASSAIEQAAGKG
jgi:hypothetical protein